MFLLRRKLARVKTFRALAAIDYPDFEIIAINDGSTDRTAEILDSLVPRIPQLRVVHLAQNQGKSTALNVGALLARSEILVGTDGDALLDRHSLTWFVRRLQSDARLGGVTGNPRIRNRASVLGRLQVGEFSSIIGLIKRAQTVYGGLFTVCGVMCAFRKRALQDTGWWSRETLTDDVEVSWRVQLAGWRLAYEPKAICWILMPETLKGLWRQRLRWSIGGSQTILDSTPALLSGKRWRLFPIWINYVVSILWAYAVVIGAAFWAIAMVGIKLPDAAPIFSPIPGAWGIVLAATYLHQRPASFEVRAAIRQRNVLDCLVSVTILDAAGAYRLRRPTQSPAAPARRPGDVDQPGSGNSMKSRATSEPRLAAHHRNRHHALHPPARYDPDHRRLDFRRRSPLGVVRSVVGLFRRPDLGVSQKGALSTGARSWSGSGPSRSSVFRWFCG